MISVEDVIEMSGIEVLHPGGLELSRRIGEIVHLQPSLHVLDVSSGKGVFACSYASEFGCRVTGLDINPRFIAQARIRAEDQGLSERVEFREGDSRNLPFPDREFDVVVNECAVGLTAIGNPQQVLNEMARVAKPGAWVVIHESIWLKDLPANTRKEAARRLGTEPYSLGEWKRMLVEADCPPVLTEDWSGLQNLHKMRPEHRWSRSSPADFLTTGEKLLLLPKVVARHGFGALVDIQRSRRLIEGFLSQGALGYALIAARKH